MGNTNNSGRNQKKDYSSLLGTEVWTNLNKKWSNVPGAVIDFDSFFRIIKYSYEGIVSDFFSEHCYFGVLFVLYALYILYFDVAKKLMQLSVLFICQ